MSNKSICDLLHDLAWHQHEHDRLFHNDIFNMKSQDKVKHFVFHLTKYSCNLSLIVLKDKLTEEAVVKPLLDSFIICLSLVNTFRIRFATMSLANDSLTGMDNNLAQFMPGNDTLRELSIMLAHKYKAKHPDTDYARQLIIDFIELTAQAAKAVEAWDHLEDYPFIQKLNELIPQFLELTLVALNYFGINYIEDKYYQRMKGIQSKHPFYDEYYEVLKRNCKTV